MRRKKIVERAELVKNMWQAVCPGCGCEILIDKRHNMDLTKYHCHYCKKFRYDQFNPVEYGKGTLRFFTASCYHGHANYLFLSSPTWNVKAEAWEIPMDYGKVLFLRRNEAEPYPFPFENIYEYEANVRLIRSYEEEEDGRE